MVYISLPEGCDRLPLSFYLATEEYLAREKRLPHEAFFMWQVEPSVIFGRNQLIDTEVNTAYCRTHGIRMYRRKSGGGCVYADRGNIMFSYITPQDSVALTYNRYITMVVTMLRQLGLDAHGTPRNDILVGQRKVSGNAFYHLPGYSVVHGTMLYDTNMENMMGSITPDTQKLESKGVKSVRGRITLLKEHLDLSIDDFKQHVRTTLCHDELCLTADDLRRIREIEREYLDPAFIYGRNPRYTVVRRRRIEGVGTIEVHMEVSRGVLKDIDMFGDYFIMGDLDSILHRMKGTPFNHEALLKVVPDTLPQVVRNLSKRDFVELIMGPLPAPPRGERQTLSPALPLYGEGVPSGRK